MLYKFGFNGKLNDNDVKGLGLQQDYGMRIYDPRIGKFLSVDPLTKDYPWYTPYQFAGNKPISFIDRDGLEEAESPLMKEPFADPQLLKDLENYEKETGDYTKGVKLGKTYLRAFAAASVSLLTYGMAGASMSGGFALRPLATNMTKLGLLGSGVNAAISFSKGDGGYDMVKSAVSGFFSGASLGLPWTSSLRGILVAGGISGAVGEVTNQVFDNTFGTDKGYSLERTLISGGIGAVANFLSGTLVDKINNLLDQQLAKEITKTETATYRETIKKAIMEKSPRIGPNQLKKAVNSEIRNIQNLLRKQTNANKAAAKQAIERGIDYMSDQSNQILQPSNK